MKYIYFDHDNALFRMPADSDFPHITEVKNGDKWVPYKGPDFHKPAWYGSEISPEEAGEKE